MKDTESPCRFQLVASLSRAGRHAPASDGHRKLPLAALAPQFENGFAVIANVQVGDPLRPGLRRCLKRHFHAERKTIVSARRGQIRDGREQQQCSARWQKSRPD